MDYRTYEKRLYYLVELIEKKRLRNIETAAKRFGCSIRTVKRMLAHLREKGFRIRYDRLEKRYFMESAEQ